MSTPIPAQPRWRQQTAAEELASSITHGIGALVAVGAGLWLAWYAITQGDGFRAVGAVIYVVSLIGLYCASAVYHWVEPGVQKYWLQRLDRVAIFVFIAGCYTPISLVRLPGAQSAVLLGLVWGFAIVGSVLEVWLRERFTVISTVVYLIMGWIALPWFPELSAAIDARGLWWLFGGGIAYSVGVGFFWWTSLRYHHAIWHLCVVAGTACHFWALGSYVLVP